MRASMGLCLIAGLLIAADDPKQDEQAILGTWMVVKAEREGKPFEGPVGSKMTFAEGGKATFLRKDGDEPKSGRYTLETSKSPRRLTVKPDDPEEKEVTLIYRIEGKTLTVCHGRPGEEPPSEFSTKPDQPTVMVTLEREQP